MSTETTEPAAVAKAYFEAVGERDVEAMMAFWRPGGVGHIHGIADLRAPEGYREWFGALFTAFPDYRFEIISIVADEQRAAVRWRSTGTFNGTGRFEGMIPNGQPVSIEGCDLLEIRDGRIVDLNAYLNASELARQLGALPPIGSPPEKAMFAAFNLKTRMASVLKRI